MSDIQRPSNKRVAALRHLHDKLKSGDYDGTDVMAAWIAVEDLACLLERVENEPRVDPYVGMKCADCGSTDVFRPKPKGSDSESPDVRANAGYDCHQCYEAHGMLSLKGIPDGGLLDRIEMAIDARDCTDERCAICVMPEACKASGKCNAQPPADLLKRISDARLEWSMVCQCTCSACTTFDLSIRHALAKQSETPPVAEWQPMETAPKDGSLILCLTKHYGPLPLRWGEFGEGSIAREKWKIGEGPIGGFWWSDSIHNWTQTCETTHWMPLPSSRPTKGEAP
jgi:hypothetical protein